MTVSREIDRQAARPRYAEARVAALIESGDGPDAGTDGSAGAGRASTGAGGASGAGEGVG
ncbi:MULTISPECIES: hypothetical protein [unclassified Streptomyces]|uniref:hypothetical protein n=1 Tax=unclassified Streptomyces TaxID=2593676 RepID=UPI00225B15DE|nr:MULTISPECIES: hypothetical protein [unclassified Streptomyces]MCX4524258.1 hypothetical protein [Streptomyces sp. NBC_01551]MCX4545222.1 hypothetical protein [Streptomyces sp. NBC_01565]